MHLSTRRASLKNCSSPKRTSVKINSQVMAIFTSVKDVAVCSELFVASSVLTIRVNLPVKLYLFVSYMSQITVTKNVLPN